jgi:hypothetical protein
VLKFVTAFRTHSRSWFTSLTIQMQFTYQTSTTTSNMSLHREGLILPLAFVPTRKCADPGKAKRTSRTLFSQGLHSFSNEKRRSQWPSGLSRRSTTARLLRSWVRIPSGAWMSVCCECCVLSGRGLCDELTTLPEDSCLLWCVAVCGTEISSTRSQTSINSDWTYEIFSLEGTSSP